MEAKWSVIILLLILAVWPLSGCRSMAERIVGREAEETPKIFEPVLDDAEPKEEPEMDTSFSSEFAIPQFVSEREFYGDQPVTKEEYTDLPLAYPEYLPEGYKEYGSLYVDSNGMVKRLWYSDKDKAFLEISECRTDYPSAMEYFTADLEYLDVLSENAVGYIRYCASQTHVFEENLKVHGYMQFLEEAYEPECRKILASIVMPEN